MKKIFESRMTTALLILLIAALAVHILGTFFSGIRGDLTADNLYSLTPGTEQILGKMQQEGVQPLDVSLYFSQTTGKTLPKFIKDFITYERYLRNLLKEYERAADGRIRLHFIDPLPDSDDAEDAQDFGLEGKPINQQGDLFFFGLVVQTHTGSREVIPFLWPNNQESVEYEISKKIYTLLWPGGKKIGVLSSLEVLGSGDNPYLAQMLAAQGKTPKEKWVIFSLLEEQGYKLSAIEPGTDQISQDDFDLVIALHPKDLADKSQWALDEWITKGGNALVLLDPYSLDDQPPQNPQQPWAAMQYKPASNLDKLLEAWGLSRPEDRFAADFELAVRRPVSALGGSESVIVDLAIDEKDLPRTLSEGHPVVQGLGSLRFFLSGILETSTTPEGVTVTPLVTTTADGNALTIQPGFGADGLHFMDLNEPAKLRDRYSPGGEPLVLAAMIQGKLPSAFPNGGDFLEEPPAPPPGLPPGMELPEPEGGERIHKDPVPEDQRQEATVLVFADVDFVSDQVAFQQSLFGLSAANDNHKLFLNSVDFLLGAEELMQVRAKRPVQRPFTRFDDIEASAEKETLERERQLRAEIETFQQELNAKLGESTERNAALLEKRLGDEVDRLNDRMKEANRELREIRKDRRAALESEEAKVRFSMLWLMPALVLGFGVFQSFKRRERRNRSRRG
ncbi:MAG: GldG family protein [Deltaproteobacteria bacterium]|nr:GldG family protein [Deltaproteobacteria bacterium]